MVLAQIAPDAAAEGVPIPGKQESPQRRRPSTGVFKLGNGNGKIFFNKPAYGADVPAARPNRMFHDHDGGRLHVRVEIQ